MMKKILLTLGISTMIILLGFKQKTNAPDLSHLKEGDILFQSSNSDQSVAIKLATHSKFSHVGVVVNMDGKLQVIEAVEPVRIVSLNQWVKQGNKGYFEVKRLKDLTLFTQEVKVKMRQIGEQMLNKHYDFYFGWEDDRIYCSELVYKIYERGAGLSLCELKPLKSYDLSHPIVKKKLKERYGSQIPMDEPMVSPEDIYQSFLLESVD